MAVPPDDKMRNPEGVEEADQQPDKNANAAAAGDANCSLNEEVFEIDDVNSFRDLVNEIKDRLADLSEREHDLRRREDEYTRRQDAIQRLAAAPETIDENAGRAAADSASTAQALADLERLKAELLQRTAEVDSKRAVLKDIADKLEIQRAAIDQRRAVVDGHAAELAQSRAENERMTREIADARDQLDARGLELDERERALKTLESRRRQDADKLEEERRRIKAESETLSIERKKLATLHLEPDEIGRAPAPAFEPRSFADDVLVDAIPKRTWRRRGVMLAALVGLAAGSLWLAFDRPRYRGVARIQVDALRAAAAREHADGVLTDKLDKYWSDAALGESWRAARLADRIGARMLDSKTGFELTLDSAKPGDAQSLPAAAAVAYSAYLEQLPGETFRSIAEIDWLENRTTLLNELRRRRENRDDLRARLADLPRAAEREEAQAAFDSALDQFEDVVERLRVLHEQVVALESRDAPRGEVPPEAWNRAFEEDPLYQEDLKEFASEARQYRRELTVAMVLAVDPLSTVMQQARDMSATIDEQLELQPPAHVRTVLEQCAAQVEDFVDFLAEFVAGWRQRRETIERLQVAEQIVELVNQHGQTLEAADRVVEESRRILNDLHKRVDAMAEAEGAGTREMVVVSVLRGDLSRLSEQIGLLAEASAAVNPESNFRLDAHDRQLRGLRTRLRDRKERIRATLQAEADREAQDQVEMQQSDLQSSIRVAENERQALMQKLVENLRLLRSLDERHQELRQYDAEADAEDAAIRRLEQRLAELEADKPPSKRDKLTVASTNVEQIGGRGRWRDACLSAAGAFVACNLLLLLFGAGAARQYRASSSEEHE